MQILRKLHHAVVPAAANGYRPHALRKESLAAFLAVTLVAEAYFTAGIMGVNPSQPFLAAVSESAASPRAADWVLAAVVVVLGALIALAVATHAHIQPTDILLPAIVIVGIAVLLIALNAWYAAHYGIT